MQTTRSNQVTYPFKILSILCKKGGNTTCGLWLDIVQKIYSQFFSNGNFKLVRATFKLEDVEERDSQEALIRQYHSKSVHRGIEETSKHIKRKYYFPNMKELITKIINNCDICGTLKYERQRNDIQFELTETPKRPLEIVHIDIYNLKNQNILTIFDKFTKFAAAYFLTSRNSINIMQKLREFFSHHGFPQKIISDNAQEFISSIFKDFLKLHNINHHTSCAKNSTGNSPVERFHSTLTELARIIYDQDKSQTLKDVVDGAVLAYNNSIHSVTNLTPFELLNGHYPRSSMLLPIEFDSPHEYIHLIREDYDYYAISSITNALTSKLRKLKN